MWDAQIDAFAATRRVLRYDTRGHGQSGAGKAPYDFDMLTGDILALFDALGIERADFVGVSLGGMTGLALALRAPDRVHRLVCSDARADAPEPYRAIWDANIARLHAEGLGALIEPTLARWFTGDFLRAPENAATLKGVRDMIAATSPTGYEGVGRLLQSLDLLGRLGDLGCPTLYVTGAADMAAPVAVVREMADRTPDAGQLLRSKGRQQDPPVRGHTGGAGDECRPLLHGQEQPGGGHQPLQDRRHGLPDDGARGRGAVPPDGCLSYARHRTGGAERCRRAGA
jgi:3-oxoadipate enol-lactonase